MNETDKEVKKLEQKWQDLKIDFDRLEMLLQKAKQETETPKDKNTTTLRETTLMQLREQENIYAKLKNVNVSFSTLFHCLALTFFSRTGDITSSHD
jgi:hypothetical protein